MSRENTKTIADKLNSHHRKAISAAQRGDYRRLLACIMQCQEAINKADAAIGTPLDYWARPTKYYYVELQTYLRSFIDDKNVKDTVTHLVVESGGASNG